MNDTPYTIGIVGLGVMGSNLGLNLIEHGYSVAGYDLAAGKAQAFAGATRQIQAPAAAAVFPDLAQLVAALRPPRSVLLSLPAGTAVDNVIEELIPLLQREDIIIDAGNSHFTDTDRRTRRLASHCVHFLGLGVSGGAEGARHGPSLMPGGSKAAWEHLQPFLEAIAARADGRPCVAWLGRDGAGHFVKMVHNGIEYGLMELIGETYDLLRRGAEMKHDEMHLAFTRWARDTASYLLGITADILTQTDGAGNGYLLDHILDTAAQSGTGGWTSATAAELQVPVPIIDAAVSMRAMSRYKGQRQLASELLTGPFTRPRIEQPLFLLDLGRALYGAMILTYAQGLHLLREGSLRYGYHVPISEAVRVWGSGCIIRSRLLDGLHEAYRDHPQRSNPLFDPPTAEQLEVYQGALRQLVQTAARWGIPVAGFMAALSYYDAFRSQLLPANLIQAQRDYFGAHTFQRTDREGRFHIDWNGEQTWKQPA